MVTYSEQKIKQVSLFAKKTKLLAFQLSNEIVPSSESHTDTVFVLTQNYKMYECHISKSNSCCVKSFSVDSPIVDMAIKEGHYILSRRFILFLHQSMNETSSAIAHTWSTKAILWFYHCVGVIRITGIAKTGLVFTKNQQTYIDVQPNLDTRRIDLR